jgi:predicted O-methyltransferase YrrM
VSESRRQIQANRCFGAIANGRCNFLVVGCRIIRPTCPPFARFQIVATLARLDSTDWPTFELDKGRAAIARKHFQQAGVADRIVIVEGDAHKNIAALHDAVDIAFIDAEKNGYVDYLNKLLPLIRPGGLILAHITDMVPDYMKAVASRADLDTVVYTSGGGMAVTLKKR